MAGKIAGGEVRAGTIVCEGVRAEIWILGEARVKIRRQRGGALAKG